MNTPTPEREVIERESWAVRLGLKHRARSARADSVKGSGSKRDGQVHGLVGRGRSDSSRGRLRL